MAVGIGGEIQGQCLNNQKMIFYQIKLRTFVIPPFHGISTCKSFYGIMSVFQGDLRGQRVNFKVKFLKIIFATNTNINKHHNLIIMEYSFMRRFQLENPLMALFW